MRQKPVAAQAGADDHAADSKHAIGIQSKDIQGLKYFDTLLPLLERLHGEKCNRDKANNRELYCDKYCMLVLLYLFNPTVSSFQAIAQASELAKVQKKTRLQTNFNQFTQRGITTLRCQSSQRGD